ncbi:hypothetical protein BC834DRAFT_841379 [Gloeopeniophorella convolvens]|nr:hypothetical protein BC834DRAFT_841379 [Gloeopeniophorella convolvens]
MFLVNIPILISAAISTHVAFTPPAAPSKVGEEKTAKDKPWSIVLAEFGATHLLPAQRSDFAFAFQRTSAQIAGRSQHLKPRLYTDDDDFLGYCNSEAVLSGIGRLFTFNLSILENHKLVTTGPYSIVRHPSYTGGALVSWGLTLAAWCPGTWWVEARVIDTVVGKAVAVIWVVFLIQGMTIYARAATEDAVLRKEFGKEWEGYASKVPYRYIPGIL